MAGSRIAVVARCPTCANEVVLAGPEARGTCAGCGAASGVPPELAGGLAELVRLHAEAGRQQDETEQIGRQQRRIYGWAGRLITLAYAVACLVASFLPIYLWRRGVLEESTLDWLVPTSMLGTYFGLGIPLLIWVNAARASIVRIVLDGPLTEASIERALAEAERNARAVQAVHAPALRSAYLRASRRSAAGCLDFAIGGAILVPLTIVAIIQSVTVARGLERDDGQLWLLWGIVAAGLGIIVLLRLRRRARLRRLFRAVKGLISPFGGTVHKGPPDSVAWLNEHWPADTAPDEYFTGPYYVSAEATVRGYPVMVEFEPYGLSDETVTFPPRLRVYVASATARVGASESAGFAVEVLPGVGLMVSADPKTVAAMRKRPARMAVLEPVVTEAVALADRL